MRSLTATFLALTLACLPTSVVLAQAECDGWGDFRGIRVEGQLMPFGTSLRATSADGKETAFTAAERVDNPHWSRNGKTQTCTGSIAFKDGKSLRFVQTIEDIASDSAKVTIEIGANADLDLHGIEYVINVPASEFSPDIPARINNNILSPVILKGPHRQLELRIDKEVAVSKAKFIDTDLAMQEGLRLPRDPVKDQLLAMTFTLASGKLSRGQSFTSTFAIKATGDIDKKPVVLTLDATHPGAPFLGIGGNFRMQSPADDAHVKYNLDNLRISWSRVAMPLAQWQPREDADPFDAKIDSFVLRQMEMAHLLAQKKIPIIISIWSYPQWALLPPHPPIPGRPGNIPALRIKPDKMETVYDSIVGYLGYLKSHYQVEPALISLNEPDLGIDILQTPEEHAAFIKQLGARLVAAGFTTRMLLADACSPHPVKFPDAAIKDPDAVKYIGGISFHSWHDGTREEFIAWRHAATKLNVPLFIGEGGTDSDAYHYPAIFHEPWFAVYELDTYLQICNDSQPASILQWQLTGDYSVLIGGGELSFQPARRFFQLKQLNLTPPGASALPIISDSPAITAAAHGNLAKGVLAIHLLNNGATRQITLPGLPDTIKVLHVYVTDATRGMAKSEDLPVTNGTAILALASQAYMTLLSVP